MPFFKPFQVSATLFPKGVIAPIPVTTTRLFSPIFFSPYIAIPLSIRRTSPVTYFAVARYATASATSSTLPILPRGDHIQKRIVCLISVISVSINPGAMALQRMPRGASPFATDFVKPIKTCFRSRVVTLTCVSP